MVGLLSLVISIPPQFVLETRLDLNKLPMIKDHLHTFRDTPVVDRLMERKGPRAQASFLYSSFS